MIMMPLINYLESVTEKFSMQFGLSNIELKTTATFSNDSCISVGNLQLSKLTRMKL